MEEEKKFRLSNIAPYLGSFIIFLGVTRLILYYRGFGINIVSFLDFTEIITSFFDILVIAIIFAIVLIIQNLLVQNKKIQNEKKALMDRINSEECFRKRLKMYYKAFEMYIISCIILIILDCIALFLDKTYTYKSLLILVILCLTGLAFLIIVGEITHKLKHINPSQSFRIFYSTLLILMVFLSVLIGLTVNEINTVKNSKSYYGTAIKFANDSIFTSDSLNYYIGKTQNYLFIYHQNKETTDVYPMNQVKQITFREKKKNTYL